MSPAETLNPEGIRTAVHRLGQQGYDAVVTAALTVTEQRHFATLGFDVHDRLHLLRHDLTIIPETPPRPLRRGYRWHREQILEIDHRAFAGFWRLDRAALGEAIGATPVRRIRLARHHNESIGYAITGRAERQAYLQRLAVDPAYAGNHYGAGLVVDALTWAKSSGCESMAVNTQESNTRALLLYERLGFERLSDGLAVLKLEGVL